MLLVLGATDCEPVTVSELGAASSVVDTLAVAVCELQPPLVAVAVMLYGVTVVEVTDTLETGLAPVVPIIAPVADHA